MIPSTGSVVVAFSLVPDSADMDASRSQYFEEHNIAAGPKRDYQLTHKRTVACFAAAKRANCKRIAAAY